MSLKSIFFPDNKKFFVLLDTVGDNLGQMSQLFVKAIGDEDKFNPYILQLQQLEEANDTVTHKLFIELGKNFITPFDREDMHFLASGLDDIADAMFSTVKQMQSHQITDIDGIGMKIAGYNLQITTLLQKLIYGLRNIKNPHALITTCTELGDIIAEAQNKVDHALYALFRQNDDAVAIIRSMDHHERLQHLLKKSSDVVNVIESIIIKYG